jgi:hypothetical protein
MKNKLSQVGGAAAYPVGAAAFPKGSSFSLKTKCIRNQSNLNRKWNYFFNFKKHLISLIHLISPIILFPFGLKTSKCFSTKSLMILQ